ncbi:hypothetical protein CPB86DRAFT_778870 [Serendipita vermifera]|nr:hypothetical protein CPB86DRAFT_778870 [Serendipita vermifera]
MLNFVTLIITALPALLSGPVALAQDTTGITPCILNCSQAGVTSGLCEALAPPCVCTNIAYQNATRDCILRDCPDQLEAAEAVQAATCGGTNSTSSASSGAGTPTGSTSNTGSSSAPPSSSTSSSSTGAGFQTASIAGGVTLALFGAAVSLF